MPTGCGGWARSGTGPGRCDALQRGAEVTMNARRLSWLAGGLAVAVLAGLVFGAIAQDQAKDVDKIPKKVMDALKSKFPNAIIHKWTKEKEGDDVVYDIEFKEK